MAGQVGTHQQGAFSTPTNGQSGDAAVVLANDNANRTTANAHDADATIHLQSSALASRPAAGTAQRVWITTDGKRAYLDSGSVWDELAYLSLAAGGAVTGAVTMASTLAVTGATSFGDSGSPTAYSTNLLSGTVTCRITADGTAGSVALGSQGAHPVIIKYNASEIARFATTGNVITTGGLTVSAGGVTISAGGLSVTGGIAGTLSTAAQPNITSVGILASTHLTSPVVDSGGLSITAGGLSITAGGLSVTAGHLTLSAGHVIASAQGMFGVSDGAGSAGFLGVSSDTAGTASTGAATLPVAPVGFLAWKLGTTSIKIPYYAN